MGRAPDAARKNGKYYLYFPAKRANNIFQIGVAVGDSPTGPFKAEPEAINGSYSIDPAVLENENGQHYMHFDGTCGGQPLLAGDHDHRFFEASWVHKYNGKYYFSYSTSNSHFICYATGDSPYGPFTYDGQILTPAVGWTTHHSICQHDDRWYLFYHDSSLSKDVTHLRPVKMAEIQYDINGKILPLKPYENFDIDENCE